MSYQKKISRLGGIEETEKLRFSSDYFCREKNILDLINLLKDEYTIKGVSEDHKEICGLNWKRFYTTNYDESIERASNEAGRVVECIDLSYSTEEYYKRKKICVHLNGSINSLTEKTLNNNLNFQIPRMFLLIHLLVQIGFIFLRRIWIMRLP